MARKILAPCTCSSFEFGTYDPETEQDDTFTTECSASTHSKFAMGHDAKLVGYLVRADMAGLEISRTEGGMRVTYQNAVHAASAISDKLAEKAQHQLDAAHRREMKKASKPAKTKVAAVPLPPANRAATIKVGRWTYPATIDSTGLATYTTKQGEIKALTSDKYTEQV